MRSLRSGLGAGAVALGLLAGAYFPAGAQQRGDTQTSSYTLPFFSGSQSVWGPGESTLETVVFPLFDESVGATMDESVSETWGTLDIAGYGITLEVGGSVDLDASVRVGMNFEMATTGQGDLRVTYPVGADVVFPAANSFAPGDPVTILTSWSLETGAELTSESPEHVLSLNGPFRSNSSVGGEICILECFGQPSVALNAPDQTINFFSVGDAGIGAGDQFQEVDRWEFGIAEKFLLGITGHVENPRQYPTGTISGNTLSGSVNQHWLDINWDLDTFLSRIGLLQGPGGIGVNTGSVAIGYNVWDLDQDLSFHHNRRFNFEATPQVTIAFGESIDWIVKDAAGNELDFGTGDEVSFDVGNSLTVFFPSGRTEPIGALPTYTLPNTIDSYGAWTYAGNMRDTLLNAELKIPVYTGSGNEWHDDGDYEKISCPSVTSDPVGAGKCAIEHAWGWAKRGASDWWKWVSNQVLKPLSHTFGAVDSKWGPEHASTFAQFEATETYHDASWELEGFEAIEGAGFALDPEDPSIAVQTSVRHTALGTGANYGTVTQTILVTNTGDIRLEAASVLDALTASGTIAEDIQSFDMTVNATYDGQGDAESLATGQTIPVGGSATIEIRFATAPGTHLASVQASGTSPVSLRTVSDAAAVAFAWSVLDIQPDDVNRKSRGTLPVHLYGTPGLSVADIDRSSLSLEGVAPSKVKLEDLNLDGLPDLKLHFEQIPVLAGLDARMASVATVASSAQVAAATTETFAVSGPQFTSVQVASALFTGGAGMSRDDILAMDRAGNGNGRLDVGDLRAVAMSEGHTLALAKGGNGKGNGAGNTGGNGNGKTNDGGLGSGAPAEAFTFVLSGNLNDGTPFWAEDHAMVQGDAR